MKTLKPASMATTVRVEAVSVFRGEFVTVFLRTDPVRPIQVELHIDEHGVPRVVMDAEHMGIVTDYESVYERPTAPEHGEDK